MGPRLDAQGGGNSHEATWRRGTAAARFHLGNPRGAGGGGGGVSQLCTPAQAPTLLPPDSSKLREDRQPEGCGGGATQKREKEPTSPGALPRLPAGAARNWGSGSAQLYTKFWDVYLHQTGCFHRN